MNTIQDILDAYDKGRMASQASVMMLVKVSHDPNDECVTKDFPFLCVPCCGKATSNDFDDLSTKAKQQFKAVFDTNNEGTCVINGELSDGTSLRFGSQLKSSWTLTATNQNQMLISYETVPAFI